jgi:hypothetical protein
MAKAKSFLLYSAIAVGAALAVSSLASRQLRKAMEPPTKEDHVALENIARESSKFNSTITNLFANPTQTNAENAQRQSMVSFVKIFLYGPDIPRPTANNMLSNYISQANLCLQGFKQVPNSAYVSNYVERLKWRRSLAERLLAVPDSRGLLISGLDYQRLRNALEKEYSRGMKRYEEYSKTPKKE